MATRLAVETVLYSRWGGLINFVFQNPNNSSTNQPVTPSSPPGTAIYNDPIGFALGCLGFPIIDPSAIVDQDVSLVGSSQYFTFLDLAEYRMIRSVVGNFTDTNESAQDRSQSWAALADRAQERATELQTQYTGLLTPYNRRASSGSVRNVPITAFPPRWFPGAGRGRGGYGGGYY